MIEDFVSGEIFFETDGAGSTEETAEGTAGLSRDTEGMVRARLEPVTETDGLDLVSITSFKENLVGLVTANFMD